MCKFHWKDRSSFVMKNIANLYKHGLFADCTVNVEGQSLSAHKIVLAATSPYFEQLLKAHPDEKMFVLNEMKYQDFKSVLEFIYNGFIEISCGKEQSFFQVAQFLQLQITDTQPDDSELIISKGQNDCPSRGHCVTENCSEVEINFEECKQKESGSRPLALGLPSDSSSNMLINKSEKVEPIESDRSNVNDLPQLSGTEINLCKDEILDTEEKFCPVKPGVQDHAEMMHNKKVMSMTKSPQTCRSMSGKRDRAKLGYGNIDSVSKDRSLNHFEDRDKPISVKNTIDSDTNHLEEKAVGFQGKGTLTSIIQMESTQESMPSACFLDHLKFRRSPSCVLAFTSSSLSEKRCCEEIADGTSGGKEASNAQLLERRSNEKDTISERKEETSVDGALSGCKKSVTKIRKEGSLNHRIHDGKKGFVCKICEKVFRRRDNLNVHMQIHSPDKSFLCSVCGKPFSRRSNLQRHIRIHSGEKPFLCKDCGKAFNQHSSLKAHITIHSGDKPFLCEDCGKSFARRNYLQEHEKIHSGALPFTCKECGKSFSQHGSLQAHMRTHTGDKPFLCEDCGKSFSQSSSLQAHMRTHSGDKPFSCEDCGKSFSRLCNLLRHKRVHSGEKPFSCKECGKSFSQQGSLKAHMKIHSGN